MEGSGILYREANLFSNSLVWIAAIGLMFASVYLGLPEIFAMASDKAPTMTVAVASSIFIAVGFIFPCVLYGVKLRIQVRQDGLYVKVSPFHTSFKKFPLADLKNCEQYLPQDKEENKLGLRYALSKKSFSLGGRRGLVLEFRDGSTLLLESKHPEKIIEAIKTASSMSS